MTDFLIYQRRAFIKIAPLHNAAGTWLKANVEAESWQWDWLGSLNVYRRPARDLIARIAAEGFKLKSEGRSTALASGKFALSLLSRQAWLWHVPGLPASTGFLRRSNFKNHVSFAPLAPPQKKIHIFSRV